MRDSASAFARRSEAPKRRGPTLTTPNHKKRNKISNQPSMLDAGERATAADGGGEAVLGSSRFALDILAV